jgi:hypothetical protein
MRELKMSHLFSSRSMDVVRLDDGRFAIQIIGTRALPRRVGNFDSREEADAWILQRSMLDDEAVMGAGVIKPGPSLDVT